MTLKETTDELQRMALDTKMDLMDVLELLTPKTRDLFKEVALKMIKIQIQILKLRGFENDN